jgi:uncharacterized protein (TIGR03437 family)
MGRVLQIAVTFTLGATCVSAQSSLRPALQWVNSVGGSGSNTVVGASTDSQGNLYIVGNTSSVDFPTTRAAQRNAGGSTLIRINTASGVTQKLFPPGLSAATSIAADSRNPQTLYATSANAVWRSLDAGATWSILSLLAPAVTAEFVAVDPSNSNILYAGTTPQGLLKSADGGLTWIAMNTGITPARDGSIGVFRVFVEPKSPQVIFASATTGLFRSADGGVTWTLVTSARYIDKTLVFDPFTAGVVYLASGATINKSTDDGQTFTPLSSFGNDAPPNVLVADPLHAGVVYAGSYSGIFQSVDAGITWTKRTTGLTDQMAADPNNSVLYANISAYGIVRSTDGFNTLAPIGPPAMQLLQILVAGPNLFLVASSSNDVFAVKLDANGNIVYSTYFGGSADDSAAAMAVGSDGSVYVTGSTTSLDLPTTPSVYGPTIAAAPFLRSNFVFKLNPDGSLGWATYFADRNSMVNTIAVDSAGNPYIAGNSAGGLPTTPGAYNTQFQLPPCTGFGCFFRNTSAFVTKFNAKGAGLIYSTYVPMDTNQHIVAIARAVALDPSGNVYFGGNGNIVLVNATGSALLGSAVQSGLVITSMALDAKLNLYATGTWATNLKFPATSGAFQPASQPAVPSLPLQAVAGGGTDAFVMKWDAGLSQILAATLLGGESSDTGESIAIDGSGNVIVSGFTDSAAFPTRAPFQSSFSARAGFVAGLDSSLSHLLFSTYLGDGRSFDARAAVPDGNGNILLAGSVLTTGNFFTGGDPGAAFTTGSLVVANKIALAPSPSPSLDSIVNFASRLAAPIAPGESIAAVGSGFGPDALLLVDSAPLTIVSRSTTTLVGVMPDDAKTSGAFQFQISSSGAVSNPVYVPAAPASPGIFSMDSSGYGQGYILNGDGTMNSTANPAAPGSAITIFVTGAGAGLTPAVFVDGIYADGIAATTGPVAGLPGNVYQLSVYVPDPAELVNQNPNFLNFKLPPQVGVKLVFGAVNPLNPDNSAMISQPGLVLNVKQ